LQGGFFIVYSYIEKIEVKMLSQKAAATVIVIFILITAYLSIELSSTKMALVRARRSPEIEKSGIPARPAGNRKDKPSASAEELQKLREELAVIRLRRVVPGRCKYCPPW